MEDLITHIGKFILTKKRFGLFETKIAQVTAMPLDIPFMIRVQAGEEGSWILSWQWLPGEPEEEFLIRRSACAGPLIQSLQMDLARTKPWRAGK
jgi:hypothetical protein